MIREPCSTIIDTNNIEGKTTLPEHTCLIFLSIQTCIITQVPQHIYRPPLFTYHQTLFPAPAHTNLPLFFPTTFSGILDRCAHFCGALRGIRYHRSTVQALLKYLPCYMQHNYIPFHDISHLYILSTACYLCKRLVLCSTTVQFHQRQLTGSGLRRYHSHLQAPSMCSDCGQRPLDSVPSKPRQDRRMFETMLWRRRMQY